MGEYTSSTIKHKCNNCGKCCKFRGDIFLTPLNVLLMSQHLQISCEEFVKRFCQREGELELRLKTTGKDESCIFLENATKGKTKCKIYPARPMACYLFPLGSTNRAINEFQIHMDPFGSTKVKPMPIMEYVNSKSNGRYEEEFVFSQKFFVALDRLLSGGQTSDKTFEYLFYNKSKEELEKKLSFVLI